MSDKREYARIEVDFPLTIQPVTGGERAQHVREEILARPSVWAPGNEATLREVAGGGASTEALLASAILELTAQIGRLNSRLLAADGPVKPATLIQLSGGGGRIACEFPFETGDLFELRFEDDPGGLPAIRALGQVIHCPRGATAFGFRFDALHDQDQALLIRLIYQVQRQFLRRARERD